MQKAEILYSDINTFCVQQKAYRKPGKGTHTGMYVFIYLERAAFHSTPWLVCI